MSEPSLTLSYQQKTEPDVRLQRAVLGCGILAIDAALLLMYRYVVGPMIGALGAPGGAGMPQRFHAAMLAVAVYTLMSACVPIAALLLASSKLPRIQAGIAVGRNARRAGIAIAFAYLAARLISGSLRISVLFSQSRGIWAGQGDWRILFMTFFETASALSMLLLQVVAWSYFADLSARLRRGIYLTLATIAFGISTVVTATVLLVRIERMAGDWYPQEVRTLFGYVGSDLVLCIVQWIFWSAAAGLLQGEARRARVVS